MQWTRLSPRIQVSNLPLSYAQLTSRWVWLVLSVSSMQLLLSTGTKFYMTLGMNPSKFAHNIRDSNCVCVLKYGVFISLLQVD